MKIYTSINVYDAAKARMQRIFSEESRVLVSVSGGKDSTAMLELAIEVCRELGKLPVKAFYLDQESEYAGTIEYMSYLKSRVDEVSLYWFQVPFILTNSTSLNSDNYLHVWKEGEKWMREKEPDTIHVCPVKSNRFHDVINEVGASVFNYEKHIRLIGIRANESRKRCRQIERTMPAYKDIHWSAAMPFGYNLYPLYDWKTQDVWKYIYEHDIVYNKVYDNMYRAGVTRNNMRVSSLIHETGHWGIRQLHEIEPETYSNLSIRMDGVSDYHSEGNLFVPRSLPVMFKSWAEYRDYLLDKLIAPEHQEQFRKRFKKHGDSDEFASLHVSEIILNDYEGVKSGNYIAGRDIQLWTQSRLKRKVGADREGGGEQLQSECSTTDRA